MSTTTFYEVGKEKFLERKRDRNLILFEFRRKSKVMTDPKFSIDKNKDSVPTVFQFTTTHVVAVFALIISITVGAIGTNYYALNSIKNEIHQTKEDLTKEITNNKEELTKEITKTREDLTERIHEIDMNLRKP